MIPKVIAGFASRSELFYRRLLWYNGFLYESSGLYGKSNIRKVDPQTGVVLQRVDDPAAVFGEGIALEGNRLFQLTWHENIGYIYSLDTLQQLGTISYEGEGWGLCFDGNYFFMSDGSALIFKRDPKTFAVLGSVQVMQMANRSAGLMNLNVWETQSMPTFG